MDRYRNRQAISKVPKVKLSIGLKISMEPMIVSISPSNREALIIYTIIAAIIKTAAQMPLITALFVAAKQMPAITNARMITAERDTQAPLGRTDRMILVKYINKIAPMLIIAAMT